MKICSFLRPLNANLSRTADRLAVAVAVSLPWSTSATGILVVLWLLAVIPTLDLAALRRVLATPAGGLPVLLAALGAVGMLWSEAPWAEAFKGFASFAKLLIIPVLLVQFGRTDAALKVLKGFFFSCAALLALSLIAAMWPTLAWSWVKDDGVPVKDYIVQSGEFTLCAFVAAYVALDRFKSGRHIAAILCLALAGMFLFDIFYVATSRTALVVIPFLVILLGWHHFGWKGATGLLAAALVLSATVWMSSTYLRERVISVAQEVEAYQMRRNPTSSGLRLYFWKKSLDFVAEAPLIGHGTGSIKHMFQKTAAGETGVWAEAAPNPHNQTLTVGVQLGLLGMAVLFALWLSHLLLFQQQGLIAWIGLAVVVQNIVGSLFNSHLFDFTQGWIYVFGVGVAGGTIYKAQQFRQMRGQTKRLHSGPRVPSDASCSRASFHVRRGAGAMTSNK